MKRITRRTKESSEGNKKKESKEGGNNWKKKRRGNLSVAKFIAYERINRYSTRKDNYVVFPQEFRNTIVIN